MPGIASKILNLHTTASGTDLDEYFPSGGEWFNTKNAAKVILATQRTAETGTCTLQVFVEYMYSPLSTAASATMVGKFLPLLDLSNATQVQGVVYADAAVDTSTPFHRFLILSNTGRLTTAADNVVAVNTVHKYYNIWIPERIRFRFRSGGTTVTNTYSAEVNIAYST